MKFRFEFDIKKLSPPIHHRHKLLLVGSCFTENITEKLRSSGFSVLENPHGILFNPVSVAKAFDDYVQKKVYSESDLFQLNEAWHSWHHHSRFSGLSPQDALQKINNAISETHTWLQQTDFVIITLGSAWLYRLTEHAGTGKPGEVVANNHKAPSSWFEKTLMKAQDLQPVLEKMVKQLHSFHPGIQVIFTISPVRHLREGVVENNRSKAVLIQAVHDVVNETDGVHYFPAYELVLDDLRDYRFFAEDLVHPNYFATEYVWERFTEACISEASQRLMKEIGEIALAYRHKPFNPSSKQHRQFLNNYWQKATDLQAQHPYLDLQKEIAYFESGEK